VNRSPLLLQAEGERACATRIGAARLIVGSSALVVPDLARPVFGLPRAQDVPATRFFARAFGIRNMMLGLWALRSRNAELEARRFCYTANLAVDAVDVGILIWPIIRRQGLDRFALTSLTLGVSAALAWTDLLRLADARSGASDPSLS